MEQISKDKFTKAETITGIKYTVTLSGEELKNVIIQLLNTVSQDTMLIDKYNQLISVAGNTQSLDQEYFQQLIEELNKIDGTEFSELKITIGQQDKKLNQILLEYDSTKIELIKNTTADSVNYVIGLQNNIEEGQVQISFSYTISGITTLENVSEIYEIKLSSTVENETMTYDYIINNQVQFKDAVSIETLNNDNALFLNDCDETTLQTLMTAIVERIGTLNSQITENLGVEETENPLLYSNPFTALSVMMYNSASDSILSKAEEAQEAIEQQEKEEQEKVEEAEESIDSIAKQAHNDKFERYAGQRRGSQVNTLITTTLNNNIAETDENRKVSITLDGTEILRINDTEMQRVDTAKQFQVEMIYDNSTGLITEIKITTIN